MAPAVRRDSAACLRLRPAERPADFGLEQASCPSKHGHGPHVLKAGGCLRGEPVLAGEPLRPVELCTRDPDRVAETAKSGFGSNEIILHFSVVASRSGDKSRRDLPTPGTPATSTRRAERRSAEATERGPLRATSTRES